MRLCMPGVRLLVPSALVVVLVAGCGSDSSSSSAIVATGTITCGDITGTVSFSPPLTATGTSAERASISLTATGCTIGGGSNASHVGNGKINSSLSVPSNACGNLLNPQPISVDVAWTPASIHPSSIKVSGYSIGASPSGGGGFTLPNNGGTTQVAGSFAGSDRGASSTAAIYSDEGAGQLVAACGSAAGLASITVSSGHLALQ